MTQEFVTKKNMPYIKNSNPKNGIVYLVVRNEMWQIKEFVNRDRIKMAALKGGEGNYILQPGECQAVSNGQYYQACTDTLHLYSHIGVENKDIDLSVPADYVAPD